MSVPRSIGTQPSKRLAWLLVVLAAVSRPGKRKARLAPGLSPVHASSSGIRRDLRLVVDHGRGDAGLHVVDNHLHGFSVGSDRHGCGTRHLAILGVGFTQ